MLNHPLSKEIFPNIQTRPPLAQLQAMSSCPVLCSLEQSLTLTWLTLSVREVWKERRSPPFFHSSTKVMDRKAERPMTKAAVSEKSAYKVVLKVSREQAKITCDVTLVIISWQRKQQSQSHSGAPQPSC